MEKLQNTLLQSPIMQNPMCMHILARTDALGKLERYDVAWFVVAIVVLLGLGATVFIGMTIWCVTHGHGSFTGIWSHRDFFSLNVQCSW